MSELTTIRDQGDDMYRALSDYDGHPDVQWAIVADWLMIQAEHSAHDLSDNTEKDQVDDLWRRVEVAKANSNYLWWPEEKNTLVTSTDLCPPLARLGGISVTTIHEGTPRFMYKDRRIDEMSTVGNTPNVTLEEVRSTEGDEEKVFQQSYPEKSAFQKLLDAEKIGRRVMRRLAVVKPSKELVAA